MAKDEKWNNMFNEEMYFIEENHRNPSKHRIEEYLLLNFITHNSKLKNAGAIKSERIEPFKVLLALIEENKHLNQYQ